jgi:hypothetical protein
VQRIEKIVGADGQVSDGVLSIEVNRSDLSVTGPQHVPFVTGFQIQGEFYFQALAGSKAVLNGDMALKASEIQPFIDALLAHHLVFQAEHQHLYTLRPMVWFIHMRGVARPLTLAREIRAALNTTSVPLPQKSPAHPTTPLPVMKLARILGGTPTVGDNGVVTVDVPRKHGVVLGGVHVSPDLNIANTIQFEPRPHHRAAAVPDFAMTAGEVQAVTTVMRRLGWQIGCLYNQETAEQPQLYFSHDFKTGGPLALARQVRLGLDRIEG